MNRLFLIALSLCSCIICGQAQEISITGESPNYFLKADEVLTNGVRITETIPGQLSHFNPGDKVLVIQMTGETIDSSLTTFKTAESRSRKAINNTGKFEILQLDEVTKGSDTILYFTDDFSNEYDTAEKIQVVRLIEEATVIIKGTLNVRPWDGAVGGIVAIIGLDTVKFENGSSIDVSGKGFRGGAVPQEIYDDGACRQDVSVTVKDTLYFRSSEIGRSGIKGEGIVSARWPYTRGRGFNINGGGAGNGLFSGGGGGSNYFTGGDGGQQSAYCVSPLSVKGGWGGYGCFELYGSPMKPKIIFGGGGGSGSKKSGSTPSRGGNGGGIIMIITGTVVTGSDVSLISDGESGTPLTTEGSGAGGGAGGVVIMDASSYLGSSFLVRANGGAGSSTTLSAPWCNGAGGGGSGGVFWHSGSTSPDLTFSAVNGAGGATACGPTYAANKGIGGGQGILLKDLIIPLTGFLFNTIRGTDTICETQTPNLITASQPKGGDGTFTYSWQQSTDNILWGPAIGTSNLLSFQPVALNQTTYYRRLVNSSNPVTFEAIHDTSRVLEIFVYPAIANNNILGTDTICYNSDAKILHGNVTPVSGGNNIYSYVWQQSSGLDGWTNCATDAAYNPPALQETTNYRRIVNSALYCSDTSNHVTVTVLPSIQNNDFPVQDTSICQNSSPGRIVLSYPTGGDNVFSYTWQTNSSGSWMSIPMTSDSIFYTAGILNDTASFRRIVFSGNDHACIDTSNWRNIIVRPLIANNIISGSEIKFTCYHSPVQLNGSDPELGFGPGSYTYEWQESPDNIVWQNIPAAQSKDLLSSDLTAPGYFRRIVFSGQYHECNDISDAVEVRLNPLPTGNVIISLDTVCAGSEVYVKFNMSGNGPFNASVSGTDLAALSKNNISGPVDSIAFTPLGTQEFTMVSMEDDSGCFADISGFIPVVPVTVYDVPLANSGEADSVCGNVYMLGALKSNSGYHGLWTAEHCSFSNDTLAGSQVTAENFGPNVFTWTETNWHCTSTDHVEIVFYEPPESVSAGPDQDLSFVYETQLQASPAAVGKGKWSVSSGSCTFDDESKPDAFVTELSDAPVLKWTVTNGNCPSVSDSMEIRITPLAIPKGFTPNGDTKNDFFDLAARHAENIKIKIFNSAGILVYESNDYCTANCESASNIWIGENLNHVTLPEGTYFYIAEIKVAGKSQVLQYRSFVELLR